MTMDPAEGRDAVTVEPPTAPGTNPQAPSLLESPLAQPILLLAVWCALVAPSWAVWFGVPFVRTPFEFDWYLGLYRDLPAAEQARFVLSGRLFHAFLFLLLGGLYVRWMASLAVQGESSVPFRFVPAFLAVACAGLPWLSPDVFYGIGLGWLEAHYGIDPYLAPIGSVRGFSRDPMFQNVFPGFFGLPATYGPLFQRAMTFTMDLSGGSITRALVLVKAVHLGLHLFATWAVYRLAPERHRRLAAFAYAVNPLILFNVLTAGHNDHFMNAFLLLALLLHERRPFFWSGIALGAAASAKYMPILLVPLFFVHAWRREGPGRRVGALLESAGFVCALAAFHALQPSSVARLLDVAKSTSGVFRNSIYHVPGVLGLLNPGTAGGFKLVLTGIFFAFYAALLLWLLRTKLRPGLADACLVTLVVYFVVVNSSNHEWYMTWLLGLAAVSSAVVRSRLDASGPVKLALALSALYMPLVIFTVKGPLFFVVLANAIVWLVLVGVSLPFLREAVRTRLFALESEPSEPR